MRLGRLKIAFSSFSFMDEERDRHPTLMWVSRAIGPGAAIAYAVNVSLGRAGEHEEKGLFDFLIVHNP